jgi:hypothetical protein
VKRAHALVLATVLALTVAACVGQAATAAVAQHVRSTHASARGKIGTALPRAGAAARIRALGLDDDGGGEAGSDDGGGLATRGHAAHGTIGRAVPRADAAARISALGLDD